MIEVLKNMILGVTAAAIFSSVMLQFTHNSALKEIVRLATGLVLILALLKPLTRLSLPNLSNWLAEAKERVAMQTTEAQEKNESITQSSIAGAIVRYLSEKAGEMGISCSFHVSFVEGEDHTMEMQSVTVEGQELSVEDKRALIGLVTENCGIPTENVVFAED